MSKSKRLALERADKNLEEAHLKVSAARVKLAQAVELLKRDEGAGDDGSPRE